MLVISLGMAFTFIPVSTTALHGIGKHDAGVGSALLNTSQQVGGAVGTALLNTVAVAATTAYLAANGCQRPGGSTPALTEGYTRAFLVGAGFLVARRRRRRVHDHHRQGRGRRGRRRTRTRRSCTCG